MSGSLTDELDALSQAVLRDADDLVAGGFEDLLFQRVLAHGPRLSRVRGRRSRRRACQSGQWKSGSTPWTCVFTSGSGSPLSSERKVFSGPLLMPALPAALSCSARLEDGEVVAAVRSRDRVAGRRQAEAAAERGLVDHVRELVGVQDVGEVDERPRDRGDRDAPDLGHVTPVQRAHAVDAHARLALAPPGRNDINEGGAVATHLAELRRGQMAQCRPLTCPEHRGHELRLARERRMPDRVHATRDPMQPPAATRRAIARAVQARRRAAARIVTQPVLASRERRDQRVNRGGWSGKAAPCGS